MDHEFTDIARELADRYIECDKTLEEILEAAITEAACAARSLCFEFPNRELTGATNNWRVAERMEKELARKGLYTPRAPGERSRDNRRY